MDACSFKNTILNVRNQLIHVMRRSATCVNNKTGMLARHFSTANTFALKMRILYQLAGKIAFGALKRRPCAGHIQRLLAFTALRKIVHARLNFGLIAWQEAEHYIGDNKVLVVHARAAVSPLGVCT